MNNKRKMKKKIKGRNGFDGAAEWNEQMAPEWNELMNSSHTLHLR
jgi:hypothetical protein